jgi:hypothetical protein
LLSAKSRSAEIGWNLGRPRAGGLSNEVVALGDVRGPAGGLGVRRAGGRQIAVELVQVSAGPHATGGGRERLS